MVTPADLIHCHIHRSNQCVISNCVSAASSWLSSICQPKLFETFKPPLTDLSCPCLSLLVAR